MDGCSLTESRFHMNFYIVHVVVCDYMTNESDTVVSVLFVTRYMIMSC